MQALGVCLPTRAGPVSLASLSDRVRLPPRVRSCGGGRRRAAASRARRRCRGAAVLWELQHETSSVKRRRLFFFQPILLCILLLVWFEPCEFVRNSVRSDLLNLDMPSTSGHREIFGASKPAAMRTAIDPDAASSNMVEDARSMTKLLISCEDNRRLRCKHAASYGVFSAHSPALKHCSCF